MIAITNFKTCTGLLRRTHVLWLLTINKNSIQWTSDTFKARFIYSIFKYIQGWIYIFNFQIYSSSSVVLAKFVLCLCYKTLVIYSVWIHSTLGYIFKLILCPQRASASFFLHFTSYWKGRPNYLRSHPRRKDSSDWPWAVITSFTELCLSDLCWVDGNCHKRTTMSPWQVNSFVLMMSSYQRLADDGPTVLQHRQQRILLFN